MYRWLSTEPPAGEHDAILLTTKGGIFSQDFTNSWLRRRYCGRKYQGVVWNLIFDPVTASRSPLLHLYIFFKRIGFDAVGDVVMVYGYLPPEPCSTKNQLSPVLGSQALYASIPIRFSKVSVASWSKNEALTVGCELVSSHLCFELLRLRGSQSIMSISYSSHASEVWGSRPVGQSSGKNRKGLDRKLENSSGDHFRETKVVSQLGVRAKRLVDLYKFLWSSTPGNSLV